MWSVCQAPLAVIFTVVRSRLSLQLEVVALRHQLSVYQRSDECLRIRPGDKILLVQLKNGLRWRSVMIPLRNAMHMTTMFGRQAAELSGNTVASYHCWAA